MVQAQGGGGGYSHTLPMRVCAAQRGRDFEASEVSISEAFSRTGYNISVQTLTTRDCTGPQTNMLKNVGSIKT